MGKSEYTYDDLGRIDTWKQHGWDVGSSSLVQEQDWRLYQNLADQLVSVGDRASGGSIQGGWDYGYDQAGNRMSCAGHDAASTVVNMRSASFNELNQLTSLGGGGRVTVRGFLDEPGKVSIGKVNGPVKPAFILGDNRFQAEVNVSTGVNRFLVTATDSSGNHATNQYEIDMGSGQAVAMTYDADGNLLSDGERTFEWDELSRLTKVTWGPGQTTEFFYNPLGQRYKRVETSGGVSQTDYLLFDGAELLECRLDSDPDVPRSRFFGQGEQKLESGHWESYYYTHDHLGSVRQVLDASGDLVLRYAYSPYGEREVAYQSGGNFADDFEFGFCGHLTISNPSGSGQLMLTHYRAYSSSLSIWLSPDPIREAGGLNLYDYVQNDPINFYDPYGLDAVPIGGGVYRFQVNPRHWATAGPGTGRWNLARVLREMHGRRVNHPNPSYSGQCATGAQAMTGTYGRDRFWRDSAPDSKRNWFRGPSVSSGDVRPGTMIAAGWPNGRYGGSTGHTGVYAGTVGFFTRRHVMLAQNNPPGNDFEIEVIDPKAFFEVRSRAPYDKSRSQCTTP